MRGLIDLVYRYTCEPDLHFRRNYDVACYAPPGCGAGDERRYYCTGADRLYRSRVVFAWGLYLREYWRIFFVFERIRLEVKMMLLQF